MMGLGITPELGEKNKSTSDFVNLSTPPPATNRYSVFRKTLSNRRLIDEENMCHGSKSERKQIRMSRTRQ